MLVYVPVGIVVLFLMRGVGDYLSVYAPGWVGRQVIKSIRHDVFARFLQLPVSFFDKNGVAQLLSRLTYNIELVAEAATNAITFIVRDTLTIVGLIRLPHLPQLEADAVRAWRSGRSPCSSSARRATGSGATARASSHRWATSRASPRNRWKASA